MSGLTRIERRVRVEKIKGLDSQGWTQEQIAVELGVGRSVVRRALDPDGVLKRQRLYRASKGEHYGTLTREYYAADPERHKQRARDWKLANPVRARWMGHAHNFHLGDWRAAFMVRVLFQGGLCFLCGKPEVAKRKDGKDQKLALDHWHDCPKCGGKRCRYCVRMYLCYFCNTRIGWHEAHGRPISNFDAAYLEGCRFYHDQGLMIPVWQRAFDAIEKGLASRTCPVATPPSRLYKEGQDQQGGIG